MIFRFEWSNLANRVVNRHNISSLGTDLMSWQKNVQTLTIFIAIFSLASKTCAEESKYELSLRSDVLSADGVPANEILGIGVIGRYYLRDGWFAGATLDAYDYEFEHAARLTGIEQDPNESDIDALASNTVLSGFIGRLYGDRSQGFDWFWSTGIGVGFADINDFSGATAGGGTFDLTYDAKTEIHLMGALGTSYHFTPKWSATFAARLEHHFRDVTSTDTVSGATTTIDSQSPVGAYISIDYRF